MTTNLIRKQIYINPVQQAKLRILAKRRGASDHKFAYFDAQLWATAKLNQIPVIFSEDFQNGASIEGVRFINPFNKEFNVLDWTY
jgi:predicted nucleic acid-binding protein